MADVRHTDSSKILKRLELIKSLISLEEEDELVIHIAKLEQYELPNELVGIITLLKEKSYGKAVAEIEVYVNAQKQLAVYVDPEIETLRFEAKVLEKQIQDKSNEKAEIDKLIHEFDVRYNQELGELIMEILEYRKEKSKGTPQHEEAEKDYEQFQNNYEVNKNESIIELKGDEQKELKDKYRKASKLCHPDVVEEKQKLAAHKIFTELNNAYEKNDLQKVTEILAYLQQGKVFTSAADKINERQTLLFEIKRLRKIHEHLIRSLQVIKTSQTFVTIRSIGDWNTYFIELKQQLQQKLTKLKNG